MVATVLSLFILFLSLSSHSPLQVHGSFDGTIERETHNNAPESPEYCPPPTSPPPCPPPTSPPHCPLPMPSPPPPTLPPPECGCPPPPLPVPSPPPPTLPPPECPPPPPPPVLSPPPPPPPLQVATAPPPHKKPPSSPPGFASERIELAYHVIQKFKGRIKYDPKHITKTWNGNDVCNDYAGFVCDNLPDMKKEIAVAGVDFNGKGLGTKDYSSLFRFLDALPDLGIFHANSNNFTGTVPAKLAEKLRFIYELDFSNNKLSGGFPSSVLEIKNLTFLDIRFNRFSGPVPWEVFKNLPELIVLFINNNKFSGAIPENFGSTPAAYITLANNNFSGPIPRSIGQARKTLLEVLFLKNHLSGCLPYEIGYLDKTQVFDVSDNMLTGPIPHSFQCLDEMVILNLACNNLSGAVPEEVCKLQKLQKFSLAYNYFTQVGPECKKLIDKKVLDVRMNCISGLPRQRPGPDCDKFFRMHIPRCPLSQTTTVPCKTKYSGQKSALEEPPARRHRSRKRGRHHSRKTYEALLVPSP